jgi:phosphoglycerate dehydrogenase-like enzyme
MNISVHLLQSFDSEWVENLRSHLADNISLTAGPDLPSPAEYHILVAGRPEKEHLTASDNLHSVIIPWAGLPESTRDLLLNFPNLSVYNLHYNAVPTAELAVTLMMAAVKEVLPQDSALRAGDWRPRYEEDRLPTLYGKTALIIGYGAIGRKVATICRGLGMKLVATRRSIKRPKKHVATVYPSTALHELLPKADVLFITVPLTAETTGMIGAAELALLQDGCTVVNVARGKIIDEDAFYEELKSGRIKAGLDVWYNYPDSEEARQNTHPANRPFHQLDNVVMTPHIGGNSSDSESLRVQKLAEMLNAAASGRELPNRVDPYRGY